MKFFLRFIPIVVLYVITSCEKVIKIYLNKEDPKLVVEAEVNADSTTHYVTITQTINFDEDKAAPIVSDAAITVVDQTTNVSANYSFDSKLNKYVVTNFLAKEGHTYLLTIQHNSKTYSATSTIPTRVGLDSLKIVKYPFGPQELFTVVPLRNDPAGIANYYRFQLKKNDEKIKGTYTEDDQGLDGQLTLKPLFPNNNDFTPDTNVNNIPMWKFKIDGKKVLLDSITAEVKMSCIENKIYRYFYTLTLNEGQQQSATPANPDGLFTNGALGYFSAQTSQVKKIVISNK
jgi:hypothetical protein